MPRWGDLIRKPYWSEERSVWSVIPQVTGLTEADIKGVRWAWDFDMMMVETWNRRKILVDGMSIASAQSTRNRAKVRMADLIHLYV